MFWFGFNFLKVQNPASMQAFNLTSWSGEISIVAFGNGFFIQYNHFGELTIYVIHLPASFKKLAIPKHIFLKDFFFSNQAPNSHRQDNQQELTKKVFRFRDG